MARALIEITAPQRWDERPGATTALVDEPDGLRWSTTLPWREGDLERILATPAGVATLLRVLNPNDAAAYRPLRQLADGDLVLVPGGRDAAPVYVCELKKDGGGLNSAAAQLARNLAGVRESVRALGGPAEEVAPLVPVLVGPWTRSVPGDACAVAAQWLSDPHTIGETRGVYCRSARDGDRAFLALASVLSDAEGSAKHTWAGGWDESLSIDDDSLSVRVRVVPWIVELRIAARQEDRDRFLLRKPSEACNFLQRLRQTVAPEAGWHAATYVGQRVNVVYWRALRQHEAPDAAARSAEELAKRVLGSR